MAGQGDVARDERWYQDGLKFRCTQCGACCSGEPGFVWVTPDEIVAIAKRRGMELREFEQTYVRRVGNRFSLTERPNGDCSMLGEDSRQCTVYEDRPQQCRTWPFWWSNVETPEAWRETCEVCPGAGKGDLVTVEEIEMRLSGRGGD